MSFLFGGQQKPNPGAIDTAKMEMVFAELDMMSDMFNRLVNSCYTKCITSTPNNHRFVEPDLLKGEAVCIDRCSAKFFEVKNVVEERMQVMGGNASSTGTFGGR